MSDGYEVPETLEANVRAALERDPREAEKAIDSLCEQFPDHADLVRAWHAAHDSLRTPADASRPPPARIGPFRILEELGRGGFGVVYLAEGTGTVTRRVALKVLQPGMDRGDALARFRAEQQAMAFLQHPGIAAVYEAGTAEDGRLYFAMEHVPGLPVDRFVRRHDLDTAARLRLFVQVCAAVQHAHDRGILHRDLSTRNILVAPPGHGARGDQPAAKVIDFGIAKSLVHPLVPGAAHTRAGQVVGTPGFISPEQQRGDGDVDVRTDVFALGVALRCALTGEHPGQPNATGAHLPRELGWIVARATAADRADRYRSVAALADDLENILAGRALAAAPPNAVYRLLKLARRHRWITAATTVALAALAWALVQSALAARANARYRDMVEPLRLRAAADALWPIRASNAVDVRAWLEEARPIAALARETPSAEGADESELHARRAALATTVADLERGLDAWERSAEATSRHQDRWQNTALQVAADPRFADLDLQPIPGLVPLGPDPVSGLQEFAHPASGVVPERDGRGLLRIDRHSGLVFVLVPGGTFTMGRVEGDLRADDDEPQRDVQVPAQLISKFEMTQGQWLRLTGNTPSRYGPGSFFGDGQTFDHSHPIENVSWLEADHVLRRFGLAFPLEATWEHSCRAGKRTVFTHGDDLASLDANIGDEGSAAAYPPETNLEPGFDDGFRAHAPVGRFAANDWGLHDMLGNVLEWTADAAQDATPLRVLRGGGFLSTAAFARCSSRLAVAPFYRNPDVGLRPTHPLPPPR